MAILTDMAVVAVAAVMDILIHMAMVAASAVNFCLKPVFTAGFIAILNIGYSF